MEAVAVMTANGRKLLKTARMFEAGVGKGGYAKYYARECLENGEAGVAELANAVLAEDRKAIRGAIHRIELTTGK